MEPIIAEDNREAIHIIQDDLECIIKDLDTMVRLADNPSSHFLTVYRNAVRKIERIECAAKEALKK